MRTSQSRRRESSSARLERIASTRWKLINYISGKRIMAQQPPRRYAGAYSQIQSRGEKEFNYAGCLSNYEQALLAHQGFIRGTPY